MYVTFKNLVLVSDQIITSFPSDYSLPIVSVFINVENCKFVGNMSVVSNCVGSLLINEDFSNITIRMVDSSISKFTKFYEFFSSGMRMLNISLIRTSISEFNFLLSRYSKPKIMIFTCDSCQIKDVLVLVLSLSYIDLRIFHSQFLQTKFPVNAQGYTIFSIGSGFLLLENCTFTNLKGMYIVDQSYYYYISGLLRNVTIQIKRFTL